MALIDIQSGDRLLPGPGIYRLAGNPTERYVCLIRLADLIRDCLTGVSADTYRTLPGRQLTRAGPIEEVGHGLAADTRGNPSPQANSGPRPGTWPVQIEEVLQLALRRPGAD